MGIYIRNKKGQALLELAIFGSIILMLLGIILNYGLRYNFEQKTSMSAFRKALNESTDATALGKASYMLIQDKHIPHPAHPFALGSVSPFISSASVVRDYKLQETADTVDELPRLAIDIKGSRTCPGGYLNPAGSQPPCYYLTAGFRDEPNVPKESIEKYNEIYGSTNVCSDPTLGCGATEGECLEQQINPMTGEQTCLRTSKNIRIIDSCEGEIISYDGCKRQCRMIAITNVDFCVRECERGKEPGSSKDCNAVCNQQIETPWYCAAGALENIFSFAIAQNKAKAMGLQSDYTKQTAMSNSLRKQESGGIITTTDTINWSDTTNRTIVYNQRILNPDGITVQPGIDIQQEPVATTVGETATQTCRDGVCQ